MKAFDELMRLYKNQSFALALGITKDVGLAEEVAQDAFFNVYRKIDSFKGNASFSTWLYRIVVNGALRAISKPSFEIETGLLDVWDNITPEQSKNTGNFSDAITLLENQERAILVNSMLQKLPAKYETLLRLYYLEELSIKDICSVMQISKSNAKTGLLRAREKFSALAKKTKYKEIKSYVAQ
ncbi:MAG: RNA polymerase sigma factor [Alphaproteobacteria bacterium]|nr:RNA polymerase sigma factor [Alphaproteobacteria bacterium]